MRVIVTAILLFMSFGLVAQSEADNWFFGSGTGLKFNGAAIPTPQNGELFTLEGCASISDSNGNLLFYSDGSTVWDRNHQVMPNGTSLLGDESSTQSALIVPHPTQSNIYYLFTVGSTQIPSGYHYYEVNMALNGGFGDISGPAVDLSGESDASQWSEKITAVKGDTCNSIWVISLVRNLYYAYKVDENGVNPEPVISEVNFFAGSISRGYLKVSPDGKKLASAHQGQNNNESGFYLYSFNNSTGEVSNDGITLLNNTIQTYGVEFSAQSNKLYASTIDDDDLYKLIQFDLEASNIPSSAITIHQESPAFRGALQLGPDFKIYVTIPVEYTIGTNYLDVIHFPELDGVTCDFQEDYLFFGADDYIMQGLPPFIQSFFYEDVINIVNPYEPVTLDSSELEVCIGASYTLEGEDISGADYNWTFTNGAVTTNLPTPSPPHQLTINPFGDNISGTYTLHIDTNDDCNTLLVGEANVSYTDPPLINPSASITNCDLFDSNSTDGLTLFNLESALYEITNGAPNAYDVYFYLNDLDAENDIYNQNSLPQYFSNTIPNQILTTKVYRLNSNCYNLSDLQLFVTPGVSLNATNLYGCDSNETGTYIFDLNEQLNNIVSINSLPNTIDITFFESIENALDIVSPISGSYESENNVIYFYASENGQCYGSGSFSLIINPLPPINQEDETLVVCHNEFPLILSTDLDPDLIPNYNFLWSSGEIGSSIFIYYPQTVSVTVTDPITFCEATKTYTIVETLSPVVSGVEVNINSGTVTIFTTEDLENSYALDDIDGFYQSENVFNNVPPGIHTIYIQNINDCSIVEREVYVLGFPQFFTPNNDTYNDTWSIKGLGNDNYSVSNVHIFDRYGKLLKVMTPDSEWDGVYNGSKLPSSDYWFFVDIEDKDKNIKTYKGYFSLVL